MGFVSKDFWLNGKTPRRRIQLQSLGGQEAVIRKLNLEERDEFKEAVALLPQDAPTKEHVRQMLVLVAQSLCDENEDPLWPGELAKTAGVAALKEQDDPVVSELVEACARFNGFGTFEKDDIKEAVGNSDEIPSESSSSSSPGISDTPASEG